MPDYGVRDMVTDKLEAGQKVRVVQRVHTREGDWETAIEGEVVYCRPMPTGSWFAHGKNDKLWLNRLRLKRADGELIDLNLDADSEVAVLL